MDRFNPWFFVDEYGLSLRDYEIKFVLLTNKHFILKLLLLKPTYGLTSTQTGLIFYTWYDYGFKFKLP